MANRQSVVFVSLQAVVLSLAGAGPCAGQPANGFHYALLDLERTVDPMEKSLAGGQYGEARSKYLESLRQAEANGGNREAVGNALVQLGMNEYLAGRPRAALPYFERAAANWEGVPAWQASALSDLAQSYCALHEWTRAEKVLRKAIELAPGFGRSWHLLGQIHYVRGRLSDAEDAYRKTLSLADPNDTVKISVTWNDMAVLMEAMRRYPEAIELSEKAIANLSPGLMRARITGNLGTLYWRAGRRERAFEYLRRACEEMDAAMGRGHEDSDRMRTVYANLLKESGRKKEAKAVEAELRSGLR